ncbi:MAG: SHOCT domain-containing protein [Nitrospirota bacterium]
MSKKLSVKPGEITRSASTAAIVVAAGFLVFGLVLVTVGFRESANEPALRLLLLLFGVIWAAACIGIIVFNARLLNRKGSAGSQSLFEIETGGDGRAGEGAGDFDSRLRKLEGLRKEGLITEDEYRRKRGEIMGQKW